MKELTVFYMESCPYCKAARRYMEELCEENPAYAAIGVTWVEERLQKELADRYDYYYVPCYYIGEEKILEGQVDKEDVREAFEKAL